ncbi:MAG: hypothetical protein HYS17_02705 [Micavibrio aeruginosavorus]|uniref:Transcriptional regulator-like domain-containing protein n=1 Tax=Micavibrio aeruginosavorus TaxID=349221 RepID=A0A7T5R3A6_9BACT|nr:MAG: hypothetical protein HYS17_02705 [Micavibrio aeruginosavorus]
MAKSSEVDDQNEKRIVLDWKNPKDYGYLKSLPRKGWSWEFLRRNPEYREDYKKFTRHQRQIDKKFPLMPRVKNQLKLRKNHAEWLEVAFVYDPPLKKNESYKQWLHRTGNQDIKGKQYTLSQYYAEKWNLAHMYSPYRRYDKGIRFLKNEHPLKITSVLKLHKQLDMKKVYGTGPDRSDEFDHYVPEDKVVLIFDLSLKTSKQLKKAGIIIDDSRKKIELKAFGESKKDITKDKVWINLIRYLDAVDPEINNKMKKTDIARIIVGEKSARANYRENYSKISGDLKKYSAHYSCNYRAVLLDYSPGKIKKK